VNPSTNPPIQITGISGHVGFKVLVHALQSGYTVRGVLRREAQIDAIKSQPSIQPFLDRLSFAVVPDITVDGAFGASLKDVTYVLHVASPLPSPVSHLYPALQSS
jgi:nucleoside-diphosphate-sugar epimerase